MSNNNPVERLKAMAVRAKYLAMNARNWDELKKAGDAFIAFSIQIAVTLPEDQAKAMEARSATGEPLPSQIDVFKEWANSAERLTAPHWTEKINKMKEAV